MRPAFHNRFPRRDPRPWAAVIGVVACVALLLSLAAVPTLSWSRSRRAVRGLQARVSAAPVPPQRAYDPVVRARALDELAGTIRSLVPAEIAPLEVFGLLRLAAEANDVRLLLIQPGGVELVGAVFGDEAVARRGVTLSGEAEIARLAPFVHAVRASGYPVEVRALTAARTEPGSPRFQFQLDLGFFHRFPVPAEDAGAGIDPLEVLE